jgi:crotonobetainyl-CoA:carnitine CoA-transferase CaiB-like acyl-CoA transferase
MHARDCWDYSHYWERGTMTMMDDPIYGDFQQALPTIMSHTPPRAKWEARPLGADNVKIYHELLGFSMEKIKEMYAKAVI